MGDQKLESLAISKINRDADCQPRVCIDDDVVNEYVEDIKSRKELPPVHVMHDGENYWLWDGFHRVCAYERAGYTMVTAIVERGVRRDAVKASLKANAEHGKRRTNEDKRRSVEIALKDVEWQHLEQAKIAEMCAVTQPFVSKVKKDLKANITVIFAETRTNSRGEERPTSYKPRKPKATESNGEPAADGAGGQEGKGTAPQEPASAPSKAAKESIEAEVDRYKQPIPKELRGIFLGSPHNPEPWKSIDNLLDQIRDILVSVRDEPASHYLRRSNEYTQDGKSLRSLEQFRDLVDLKRPWSLCPACKGKGCEFCDRIGWVDRMQHNTAKQGMSVNV